MYHFLLIMDICIKFLNKFLIILTILFVNSGILYADSSIAIGYTPKYPANFKNFEYDGFKWNGKQFIKNTD